MTFLITMAVASLMQAASTAPATGWTWTLYGDDGPLVLAHEVPDTPHLRTTFECTSGAGQVRLTQYQANSAPTATARLTSGQASLEVETRTQGERLQTQFRANHPVFVAFVASGRLDLNLETSSTQISLDRPSLPRLRRFAELCTG